MNICVDRMVKEIVDDELEYKKYKLSWEAKKIYDSLLPDIYYKYNINLIQYINCIFIHLYLSW